MLEVCKELRRRGADVLLWGNERFEQLADRAGVPFKAQPAEVFAEGSIEDAVLELTSSTSMGADPLGWAKAGMAFGKFFSTVVVQHYEVQFRAFDADMKEWKPDLVVLNHASGPMMDWAIGRKVKWVYFYALNLGLLAGFQDCPACPDPMHSASVELHHRSLLERLRKVGSFLVTLPYLVSVVPKLSKLQREVAGIEPYGPPTTQLNQHHVIVTNIEMFDVPRLRSPLVHLVGFMAERFNASQQPMPPDEAAWWEWLDRAQERTPAGVIYVAFGSEALLPTPRLVEIVEGAHAAAEAHGLSVLLGLRTAAQELLPAQVLAHFQKALPRLTIAPWLPQAAVLAHPATKAFITHAGQASFVQAIYGRVPMLAIPCFGDQSHNARRIQEHSLGLYADPANLTRAEVRDKLTALLHEPRFAEAHQRWELATRVGAPPAARAADVIEEELLLHSSQLLVPVDYAVPFWVATGLDVQLVGLALLLGALYALYRTARHLLRALWRLVAGGQARPTNGAGIKQKAA